MNEFASILSQLKRGCPVTLTRTVDGTAYTRKFVPTQRLILLGAGHVAQPVCHIGSMLDFAVTVVDDRPSFSNSQRFPDAVETICDSFSNAIARLNICSGDYVCVLTRGHRYDAECLREILSGEFPEYLGMIGSKRRVAGLKELLTEEGYDTEKLDKIHAPIGLSIQAVTPAEIAVSICAQLIAHRGRTPQDTAATVLAQTNTDMNAIEFLARDATPRAMLLVLETTGSTPVKSGAIMAVDRLGNGYGTIGGGCSEAAAMGKARRIIGTGKTEVISVDMTNEVAAEQGMVCGGTMRVLVEDIPAQDSTL